jgi:hypothetical protein
VEKVGGEYSYCTCSNNENICSNNPRVQEKQKREVFEDEKLLSKILVPYQHNV